MPLTSAADFSRFWKRFQIDFLKALATSARPWYILVKILAGEWFVSIPPFARPVSCALAVVGDGWRNGTS
jgi:hypothetical protein